MSRDTHDSLDCETQDEAINVVSKARLTYAGVREALPGQPESDNRERVRCSRACTSH